MSQIQKGFEMLLKLIMAEPYMNIAVIGNENIKEISDYLKDNVNKIDVFDSDDFRPNVREYDLFIINKILTDKEKFFRRVYRAVENSGYIIVSDKLYEEDLKYFLEDIGFVAVNETDKFITAKKMHGWSSL